MFYYALLIFIVNAWVVPLKEKKGITITNAFQKFLNGSKYKPNEIWVDKGSKFYNNQWNHGCGIMI